MQKLFGSRSQAIQLSSDDEEDFAGGSSGLSSGFGCVSCLPRFTMMGGNGTIQIPEEDATLDDYLDPNTTTTIEPLLEEYNNQQTDNAFNGATLQDSQRFLTRNPFASSTAKPTTINDPPTQHTFETSSGSYQEQQQHSFAGALPRVDFFLENDENDAECLSDHRISAVIGDSSKLTSQFELFEAQDKAEQLLQDDQSQPSGLDHQGGNDDQDDDSITTEMESPQPFEIQNDWTEEALGMDSKVDDIQQEFDTDSNQLQHRMQMDDADDTLTEIPAHTKTITSELNSMTASPANNNDQTADDTAEEWKPPVDALPENTSTSQDMDDLTEETKSMKLSPENNDSNMDTSTHGNVSLDEGNISNTGMDLPSLSTSPFATSTEHPPHVSNSTHLIDTNQYDTNVSEADEQNASMTPTNKSAPSIPSSPPSPMPTMSTENAPSPFPSTGLSRAPIPVQNVDDSQTPPPATPTTSEGGYQHQRSKDNDDAKSNISTDNSEDINKDDTTISSSSDTSNANQLSVGPTVADETINNTNTSDGKRRSSVAAVAHSLLGDKLDDFTEKLAYIRKNIIMSLDDDDEDSDDYYGEDMAKFRQQQQHQQLRRSRSGSMQQDMRRQSFDPSVSRLSGNAQQQQRRQLTRADTADDPRSHHRRSNSLMDGANSFTKIFQQMGGQHEGESNHQRHFSPSSFFASLAGPDIPPSSPSMAAPSSGPIHAAAASPLPQRSSSMSSPGQQQQQHQYPAVSRSATQLNTTQQQPPSRPYNKELFLQHVNEEENVDEEDLFDFSKMIAMGKNVRNISEDLMGNGIRLFNDFSTRMKNANANRMAAMEQPSSSNTTTTQQEQQQQQQQGQYYRQPQPQQEHQTSSMDQEFLLGDTYI